jgi:hypothetical protein
MSHRNRKKKVNGMAESSNHRPVESAVKFGLRLNPLTPNDLQRRRAVSPLKIKIPSINMRKKPTNTPIVHSVY